MEKTILSKLGLNEKEIEIFLFLSKNKVQTVKQIADATSINRTTAYRHIETLRQKGLVKWLISQRGIKVEATPPENLRILLDTQKREIEQTSTNLPQLIDMLQRLKPSPKLETKIRYYEEKEGIEQLFWNTLKTTESTRSYAPMRRREFIDPAFEYKLEEEWVCRGLKDKIITNENRLPYIRKKLHLLYKKTLDIRIIPRRQFYITNDIIIYNYTFAIASLEKNNLVGVEIENAEIAKTQKSIFDLIWQTAIPLKI